MVFNLECLDSSFNQKEGKLESTNNHIIQPSA